jgi:hypothetical protein
LYEIKLTRRGDEIASQTDDRYNGAKEAKSKTEKRILLWNCITSSSVPILYSACYFQKCVSSVDQQWFKVRGKIVPAKVKEAHRAARYGGSQIF